jgi:hypothetical protein
MILTEQVDGRVCVCVCVCVWPARILGVLLYPTRLLEHLNAVT